jgi:glycosyltransferase involved in cell wall biosynthesis/SAM-dependent methyltransferase
MSSSPTNEPKTNQPEDSWSHEIEKWDQFYSTQTNWEENEDIRLLSQEFLHNIASFLPPGSRVLEAGCGSGWQSLALAQSGKYQVSLLDFSREALRFAQKIFEQSQVQAEFVLDNIISPGQPEYDLVFNAGVFEHYTFQEQADLLKGMASRSRKYVMVIIPNSLCYWYWVGRILLAGQGNWPYGKEVPQTDLSKLFQAAGLQFLGNAFMAANWTDSYIKALPNLDEKLRQLILDIHHSPVIDKYQKSYLVAGLGCVSSGSVSEIPGWEVLPIQESYDISLLQSSLADTLSSKIHSEYQLTQSLQIAQGELDRTNQSLEQTRLENEEQLALLQAKEEQLKKATLEQAQIQTKLQNYTLEQTQIQANLQNQIESWQDRASTHLAELTEIKSSRMWRVVRAVWSFHQTMRQYSEASGLKTNWIGKIAHSFWSKSQSVLKFSARPRHQPSLDQTQLTTQVMSNKSSATQNGFQASYNQKKAEFNSWLADPANIEPEVHQEIDRLIQKGPYKGVVVYPHAVHWEPLQRPQQMLIEFGRKGYLCFFCENYIPEVELREVSENVYTISGEKHLLFPLQNIQVIVLCTWMYQMPFVEALPNHFLWYDLIDKIKIFSLYDSTMEKMHNEVVQTADIVTYSGLKLNEYLKHRTNILYLPNAARGEDFIDAYKLPIPARLEKLTSKGKPIIGYYGALAEWVDLRLIRQLAFQHPEWEFLIIGKSWVDISSIQNVANITYLGPVPYAELPALAQVFNVAIIPFKVDELTDCVSPIKLFEYCALGLPVITTPYYEVTQYQEPFIRFANNAEEFSQAIQEILAEGKSEVTHEASLEFAQKHQWRSRIERVENRLERSLRGAQCYANFLPTQYVAAMIGTFFHFDGREFFAGGAERYIIDLHAILSGMGIRMVAYQYGSFPWMRKYGSMEVVSVADQKTTAGYDMESVLLANRCFYQTNLSRSLLNIYSAFYEGWPLTLHPCLGISHGISWDNYLVNHPGPIAFWSSNQRVIESFRNCDALVSVDTNTPNWFQTIDYESSRKIRYLPNYVDPDEFYPRIDFTSPSEKIVILYPRRLYRARGFYLLLSVIDEILNTFPQVEFHLVGRGFEEDTQHITAKQATWGNRIRWYSLRPEAMPTAYREADICLIPTLYSEGTSLSCLEAMASGNAVIATRIGGLPDLVINDHNGLLIEPHEQALKDAIFSLVNDPARLARMKIQALEVSKSFSKRNWERNWTEILSQMLRSDKPAVPAPNSSPLIELYLNSLEPRDYILPLLTRLLQNGYLLYIRLPKDHEALIPNSFHRLQFLSWDEEIFTQPDLVVIAQNAAQFTTASGYILTGDLDQDIRVILSKNL